MPGDFDLVKERVDIVQLIGERVPLKKAGRGFVGICPFHLEKTPSFHVDPERRTYKCFGCLPPGSLIKTASGPRPIEAIRSGEQVYAGDGRLHAVLETHEHFFAGELVKLVCAPFKIPVLLTPDHKVPVIRPRSRRVDEVPAGLIKPQNYLIYPSIDRRAQPLDWAALPVWFGKRGIRPKALPKAVELLPFAEWLGWYLAEGSVSNDRSVRFSLSADEADVAVRITELSRLLFGATPRIDRRETKIEMWFCHALLSRWLKHNCGDGARNKRLPDFVWGWPADQQKAVIDALVLGDGHRYEGGYVAHLGYHAKPSWDLRLASATLVDDVRDLLLRMGVVPGMSHRTEADGRRSWQVAVSNSGQQLWGAGERLPSEPLPVRVRRVERVAYEGPVYNLTVEDEHTYLTMSGAVCNCGEGGDVFTWLEKQEGLTPAEALNTLAERAGVELTRRAPEERKFEDRLLQANDAAAFYFRQALRGTPRGKEVAAYLAKRGITEASVDAWGIGYAPDERASLLAYLKKRGFTEEEGVAAGLIYRNDQGELWDRFRARLIVPIRDRRGRAIAFGGRAMRPDQRGKYINSTGTALFNKSATLYGLDKAGAAIRKEGTAVIVEGYFDTIACHQSGFTNVVASMGTALTEDQYRVLNDMKIERAIVAFDGDAAGQRSAESRGRELLSALSRFGAGAGGGSLGTRTGLALFVTVLPEGLDPDDVARKDPELLRRLLAEAKPLLEFLIDRVRETSRLDQSEGRLRFLQRTAALITEEPDPVRREVYLSEVAGSAGVDPAFLREKLPAAGKRTQRTARAASEPASAAGGETATAKQTPSRERYVMALLTRYPEEIARADLAPTDLVDPLLRALYEQLQAGKRPDSDLPAQLAALAAALGANAPELDDQTDPGQVIELAARNLQVENLRRRLGDARVQLARAEGDVGGLDGEIARMGEELDRLMKRRERRTVLHSELEREEDR
jgi:DNA primase catalytic core